MKEKGERNIGIGGKNYYMIHFSQEWIPMFEYKWSECSISSSQKLYRNDKNMQGCRASANNVPK